eukprot:4777594-Amphidinium_carterae.1
MEGRCQGRWLLQPVTPCCSSFSDAVRGIPYRATSYQALIKALLVLALCMWKCVGSQVFWREENENGFSKSLFSMG